ncbi:MAG TPA: hypothetical protein VKA49_08310 [Flavitalea sp.]|nr:hypothetical protein [Flavitalea sp.]
MPRIYPVRRQEVTSEVEHAFEEHIQKYNGRITNMKATLARSLPAFEVYMQWYVLYEEVKKLLGNRMAPLFAFSISQASDCPLCSTFFRKIIIDNGEHPENLQLSEREQEILSFGAQVSSCRGVIRNDVYDSVKKYFNDRDLVTLIAFAGQMIATNIFSNVIETEIDDYLSDYLKPNTTV